MPINRRLIINGFCEFGPILGFIVVFELYNNFYWGVVAMMILTVVALIALRIYEKHTPKFALLSAGTVLFFGGLTLFIDIPDVFIVRDTFFDFIFGFVLVISVAIHRPLFKYIFEAVFAITEKGWSVLSLRWGLFFIFLGVVNEYARIALSSDDWVMAKIGMMIITVIFGTYQLTLTKKERLPHASAWGVVEE